jgi:Fur family peroxide stress response transcriptional regulator
MTPEQAPAGPLTDERIRQLFAEHGLRCTRQRRDLYLALSATNAHPTADILFHSLAQTSSDISLATVYNTLEALCHAGLVQKIAGPGGSSRYDATVDDHVHLRDHTTGQVVDVPDDISKNVLQHIPAELLKELEAKLGFDVHQVRIELIGKYQAPQPAAN